MAITLQQALKLYQSPSKNSAFVSRLKSLSKTAEQVGDMVLVEASEAIRDRIRSGRKVDGSQIGEYSQHYSSKGYSNRRVSNYHRWADVRQSKGLQVDYVDLSFTGGLLDSMKVIYNGKNVRIKFDTKEDEMVASELEAGYGGVFGFSDDEKDAVKREIIKILQNDRN